MCVTDNTLVGSASDTNPQFQGTITVLRNLWKFNIVGNNNPANPQDLSKLSNRLISDVERNEGIGSDHSKSSI